MATNFNVNPYYDDYDSSKNFHRVLFRPAYSVQARELTQLQTILQNQITKFGNHIFQNGSMVIPGDINFDLKYDYIKVNSAHNTLEVETYMNVLDFVDYDWNLNTITIFIQLWTLWNDTRITISNYDEEYVMFFLKRSNL